MTKRDSLSALSFQVRVTAVLLTEVVRLVGAAGVTTCPQGRPNQTLHLTAAASGAFEIQRLTGRRGR